MSNIQGLSAPQEDLAYEPLDLTQRNIRLLKLHPAQADYGVVECSLEVFDADECPKYVALSYGQGAPSPTRTIAVNKMFSKVRQNVFSFLLPYRNDRNNTWIWVDQICI